MTVTITAFFIFTLQLLAVPRMELGRHAKGGGGIESDAYKTRPPNLRERHRARRTVNTREGRGSGDACFMRSRFDVLADRDHPGEGILKPLRHRHDATVRAVAIRTSGRALLPRPFDGAIRTTASVTRVVVGDDFGQGWTSAGHLNGHHDDEHSHEDEDEFQEA